MRPLLRLPAGRVGRPGRLPGGQNRLLRPAGPQRYPEGCGHSGFTGTSLWISRTHGLGAVILTNKFYRTQGEPPGNSNEFRRAVHYVLLDRPVPEGL